MPSRIASAAAGLSLCLAVSTLASPVFAETSDGVTDTPASTEAAADDRHPERPAPERPQPERPQPERPQPERPQPERPDVRPDRPVDVLGLHCKAEGAHIGCAWRATTRDDAVGYQVWRIVDRGHRELIHRGGLDQTAIRDEAPAGSSVIRYAVLALDARGNIVARSRVDKVVIERPEPPVTDRPIDVAPVDAAPVGATDLRPVDAGDSRPDAAAPSLTRRIRLYVAHTYR